MKQPELDVLKDEKAVVYNSIIPSSVTVLKDPKIDTTNLWSKKDIDRYAKMYEKRWRKKPTKVRSEKAKFFNYILQNWDRLQNNGTVRVVPDEASKWYKDRDDSIFSNKKILNPELTNLKNKNEKSI